MPDIFEIVNGYLNESNKKYGRMISKIQDDLLEDNIKLNKSDTKFINSRLSIIDSFSKSIKKYLNSADPVSVLGNIKTIQEAMDDIVERIENKTRDTHD